MISRATAAPPWMSASDLLQGQARALAVMEKSGPYPRRHDHIVNHADMLRVPPSTAPVRVRWVLLLPPHQKAVTVETWQALSLHICRSVLSRAVALLEEHRHRWAVCPEVLPSHRDALRRPVNCHRWALLLLITLGVTQVLHRLSPEVAAGTPHIYGRPACESTAGSIRECRLDHERCPGIAGHATRV